MAKTRSVIHPFKPIIDHNSQILILGSIPSERSVQENFYYMHPSNRFWKVLEHILNKELYQKSIIHKTTVLLENKIALSDIIKSCTIFKSDDATIENVQTRDISTLIEKYKNINHIFLNGQRAFLELKRNYPHLVNMSSYLPSTSGRNASYSLLRLIEKWGVIKDYL